MVVPVVLAALLNVVVMAIVVRLMAVAAQVVILVAQAASEVLLARSTVKLSGQTFRLVMFHGQVYGWGNWLSPNVRPPMVC